MCVVRDMRLRLGRLIYVHMWMTARRGFAAESCVDGKIPYGELQRMCQATLYMYESYNIKSDNRSINHINMYNKQRNMGNSQHNDITGACI